MLHNMQTANQAELPVVLLAQAEILPVLLVAVLVQTQAELLPVLLVAHVGEEKE